MSRAEEVNWVAAEEPATQGLVRAQFGSRIGFIMAAIGSAVGFGSIARFPMNVANNGGAAFVLIYVILMVLVGIPMMISEFSLGRDAQKNTVGVYKAVTGNPKTRWRIAGHFHWIVSAFFLSWYAVVSGWTLKYVWASLSGAYFGDVNGYLADTTEGPDALFWTFIVMVMVLFVVMNDVSKGIEKVNLVLMPLLFAMVIGLAIYAATLDNVADGYAFYLRPDFSAVNISVVTAAVGQAFFSLSLGIGAMMVFASYLSRETSLASNAILVSMSTLGFAAICGFLIFPLLSAFGMLQDSGSVSGLDLIFGPLAAVFADMGSPVGHIIGTLFFLAVFFAAFSSAIALTEPPIAYVAEEHGIDRRRAALLIVGLIYIGAIFASLSIRVLNIEGGKLTDLVVILGGLSIAVYIGWFSEGAKARQRMDESDGGLKLSWYVYPMVKWVLPLVLIVLSFFAVLGSPCALSGGDPGVGLIYELFGWEGIACDAGAQ
jgi:NSS family neurotransmitter:Na+ symporter